MKKLKLLFSLGACSLAGWIPIYAHHSFQAEYDDGKPITLTGTVTKVSPDNPHGWLVTVARNRIRDLLASAASRTAAPLDDHVWAVLGEPDLDAIPDKRLELLFACAHPAIEPMVRTPLMLQVVLGFDVARIAGAFAVQPAAMAQRLVRAKRRIRDAEGLFAQALQHEINHLDGQLYIDRMDTLDKLQRSEPLRKREADALRARREAGLEDEDEDEDEDVDEEVASA